ncbi:MAG: MarR family transcriptional regulator [Paracoccaceae bacterium]|jgi:DNA-binding MarR family transcriptional regulator|uniref:MarR family winged helix-turn-helix transcriptional regulator n=1 Tax=unclassified Seohaeicola TaxID=2641111 RepID=UPI00237B1F7B|nr:MULTISPECIES: MarR family transcriptional regulator [unclassified Seohaeicola]MDD9708256.1 MarR family transcriptional regulator [Seohaeicola sp. 4SK31]MDD9736346.1 MarR family transcriptional regulator [Seohaeicola sp. SP36]MDF1707562.1 MarR family transcriptional regulator [Paracoccaceae bacterium]MDM7969518.1 MarR family transcriptional regulator [Paracoccaceae bacterium]
MDTTGPYRLHTSLGYHLSVAARQQERRLDEALKTLGLTRTTWCVLLAVGNEGLSQPSDIAGFVGIDRTATSRALRQMEADGLLARSSGTEDRRTRRVELTDKGCEAIRAATPFARANAAIMAEQLDAGEQDMLIRLLAKLRPADDAPLNTL